ncbi:MAG: ribbon-helix-helix protein, CopG family [Pirellulales bacterium]
MFGSNRSIKLDKQLYERLAELAARRGYSSTAEFLLHLCERELATEQESLDQEQVEQQLRGLGYIE